MKCPNCGASNRAGARFCVRCGYNLSPFCPRCGAPNQNRARFCGRCGAALGASGLPVLPPLAHKRQRAPIVVAGIAMLLLGNLFGLLLSWIWFEGHKLSGVSQIPPTVPVSVTVDSPGITPSPVPGAPSTPSPTLSPEMQRYIEAVKFFAPTPGLQFVDRGVQSISVGEIHHLEAIAPDGSRAIYAMDSETSEVRGFMRYNQVAPEVLISQEEALDVAQTLAQRHFVGLDELLLERQELLDHGAKQNKFYMFQWTKFAASGAVLPVGVIVQVNAATGEVAAYLSRNEEVTIPTEPQVTQAQAEEIALRAVDPMENARIDAAKLAVETVPIFETDGTQVLLWSIKISGTIEGHTAFAQVFIDAHNSEVVYIEPYL